ncbi:hypothetical protein COS31_00450, partial [Candidatus Roizmanbacteria bacterium CG02_land_8_20_14_3_00_36_15]
MDKFFPHKDLSYKIIGFLYKVRSAYGNSQKEIIYQNALVEELEEAKIPYKREVDIPIISSKTKKRLGNYRADFLIDNKIIVEIKAIKFTFNKLEQQVFSYLKSTPYEIAYLVNFGSPKLYLKRYILTNDRKFSVVSVSPKSVESVSLGFTLMELLIVIGLIALIAVVTLVFFNPIVQINKAYDAKRKHDLSELQKAFEDYYNDKGCYPKVDEVCYDADTNLVNIYSYFGSWTNKKVISQVCHICGNEADPPQFSSFSPYLSQLPCDPQHSKKQYLYNVEAKPGLIGPKTPAEAKNDCPQWYNLYANLSNADDLQSKELGCVKGACGIRYDEDAVTFLIPSGTINPYPLGYEYGVASPNRKVAVTDRYACYSGNECNYCYETYERCIQENPDCPAIYASKGNCCVEHPAAV